MSAKVSLNKTASVWVGLLWICMMPIWGATIGKVVAIGGNASDIALDSSRKVLYIANFTANRIEVMSQDDGRIQTSINVAANPSSLALSPDGRTVTGAPVEVFKTTNRYRDLAVSQDQRTIFVATDPDGRSTDASGRPTRDLAHPGAILAFTYTGAR